MKRSKAQLLSSPLKVNKDDWILASFIIKAIDEVDMVETGFFQSVAHLKAFKSMLHPKMFDLE